MTTTTTAAGDYIRKVTEEAESDARVELSSAVELYDRKLWHQLTELCLKLSSGTLKKDPELYTSFIIHFQKRINAVTLVQILTNLVHNVFDAQEDPENALAFLRTSQDPDLVEVLKSSPDALILYHSLCARLLINAQNTEEAKKELEAARTLVDATFDLDSNTHASFYRATAQFHKMMGPAADFYKYALLFLAYTSPNALDDNEKKRWAFDVSIAALVGEDIYTFEEILRHTLVKEMGQGENKWLIELMEVMNRGDVQGYMKIVQTYSKIMDAQEALVRNKAFLERKSAILGLVALAEVADGSIPFQEVEKKCLVPPEEVEYLIMRALSLGLIKGTINGVDGMLEVSKVRSRLLDKEQCGQMAKRLQIWRRNVNTVSDFMEKESGPLVTA